MEVLQVTDNLLAGLRFHGIRAGLSVRLKQAQSEQASYEQFLNLILHDEKTYRDTEKVRRLLSRAAFKQAASLEAIDYSGKRGLDKKLVSDLATGRFLSEGTNLIVSGPTGVGKSFFATAIGNNMCRLGKTVGFYRMNALVEKIHLERAKGTYLNFIKRISAFELLILDDFGIKPLEPQDYQDLYDIIDERGDEKSLILTTQLPPENWAEVISDPVTCEAITDRVMAQSLTVVMKGESYRKRRKKNSKFDED